MTGRRLIRFIAVVQSLLWLTHWLLYETWAFSFAAHHSSGALGIKLALAMLSVSFVVSSLLAFRYSNKVVNTIYQIAAVWMGLFSFLLAGGGFRLGRLRNWLASWAAHELSSDCGVVVWHCHIDRTVRAFQRQAGRELPEPRCGSQTCRRPGVGDERL